jgi:hypothetical protein
MNLNLLPSQAKFQAAKIRLKSRVKLFTWIFTGFWVALVLTIFVILMVQKISLNNYEKKLKSEQDQYKALSGDAVLSYQLKYQAKLVGKVLSDRFEYGKSIQRINNIFSSNINLDKYKIESIKHFVLDGSTMDGRNIKEVENTVKAINSGEFEDLESAKLNTILINPNGSWSFTMEVILK